MLGDPVQMEADGPLLQALVRCECIPNLAIHKAKLLFFHSMTLCRESRFTLRSISTLRYETDPRTAALRASCLPTIRRYPISATWRLPLTFVHRMAASSKVHRSGDAPRRRAGGPRLSAGVLLSRHRSMLDRKVERARSAPSTSATCRRRRIRPFSDATVWSCTPRPRLYSSSNSLLIPTHLASSSPVARTPHSTSCISTQPGYPAANGPFRPRSPASGTLVPN